MSLSWATIGVISGIVGSIITAVVTAAYFIFTIVSDAKMTEFQVHITKTLVDTVSYTIKKDMSEYTNIYTLSDIDNVVRTTIAEEFKNFKVYSNVKFNNLRAYVDEANKTQENKLQSTPFIDKNDKKYLLIYYQYKDTTYILQQVPVDEFEFENK